MAEANVTAQGAFISTEELARLIESCPKEELCILNSTVNPADELAVYKEHEKSRIPGAKVLDLTITRELSSPYPHMMPSQAHFIKMMKALNVRKSMTVVIYETGKGWFATRAAFMLKAFGHPKVYVLDGGYAKWTSEGRATEGSDDGAFDSSYGYVFNGDHMVDYERVKAASADGSF